MSNRKSNSSNKRPSPRGGNFVDLTAFGFSVTKKPRPTHSHPNRSSTGTTAATASGGLVDMTIHSSSSSDSSSSSASVIIVDPPPPPAVAAAASAAAAAAAASSRGNANSTTTTTPKSKSSSSKNHRTTTATTSATTAARSNIKTSSPPSSSSSPTSDVEFIGTSPPPSAYKRSRLFNNDPSPTTSSRLGAGKENGVATTSTTGTSMTTASMKKAASAKKMEMGKTTPKSATGVAKSAAATVAASLDMNFSFVTARTSLSSSSSSTSSQRAALLDLTLDSSLSDSSSNKQKVQQGQQQQKGQGKQPAKLASTPTKPKARTATQASIAANKTMPTLSSMGDALANEIRNDPQNQQQQLQLQQRRAKRDKHPTPIAIFADDAPSSTSPQPQVSVKSATAKKVSSPMNTIAAKPVPASTDAVSKTNAPTATTNGIPTTAATISTTPAPVDATMENDTMEVDSSTARKNINALENDSARETATMLPNNIQIAQKNVNATATKQTPLTPMGASVEKSMGMIDSMMEDESMKVKEVAGVQDKLVSTRVRRGATAQITEENQHQSDENDGDSVSIKKGEYVKVFYDATDMFGDVNLEWYLGMVTSVKAKPTNSLSYNIRVRFVGDDDNTKSLQYPAPYIEKLVVPDNHDLSELYPETFHVGDVVDAFYQDGRVNGKWFRGRIANVCDDGRVCDVMYYDGDYESNIPTTEKKIRLIQRCDEGGGWLMGKSASLSRGSGDDPLETGTVSKKGNKFMISFTDGSKWSFSYDEVAKAVFCRLCMNLPSKRKREWPGTINIAPDNAETIRSRRRKNEEVEVNEESGRPKPTVMAETAVRTGRNKASRSVASVAGNEKPPDPLDEMKHASYRGKVGDDFSDLYIPIQCGPVFDVSVLETRKTAKDFPPGLPNMLWCALNSPEAQTGTNFLIDLLCIHDSIPPTTMVQKLMDLMKLGPKADGVNIYFKDPHRTELAAQYVYSLLGSSNRLQRRDSSALFGPSSWDDIEVLFLQSVSETENRSSGGRLAQGLQLAARGAKLLSMMFCTELQGYDLCSTSSDVLRDPTALNAMPTVRLVRSYGVRGALKAAVEHMTTCLVRHSSWIMDSGGIEYSCARSACDESCCLEARACLDSLGSATCFIAWLFCVEEMVEMTKTAVAFVVKDAFLAELERSMGDAPELSKKNKEQFVRKCKTYLLMSLVEEFASPLVMSLAKMIEVDNGLALAGLVQ